jgi:two-component system, NarL family, response regulator
LVAEAASGKQAIELFRQHLPDISLVDLKLPDIHGVDVIKAMLEIIS